MRIRYVALVASLALMVGLFVGTLAGIRVASGTNYRIGTAVSTVAPDNDGPTPHCTSVACVYSPVPAPPMVGNGN